MPDNSGQERRKLLLFGSYGYDIPGSRDFILAKAGLSCGTVLEIGTGRGYMSAALAKKGFKTVSIDIDAKNLKAARFNLKSAKPDKIVTFRVMDAGCLEYKDNSFDYAVSVDFLHHAGAPRRCLREMARVAAKKLVIADLNKRGTLIMDRIHRLEGRLHPVSKVSLGAVKILLENMGMKVKTYRGGCHTVLVAEKRSWE